MNNTMKLQKTCLKRLRFYSVSFSVNRFQSCSHGSCCQASIILYDIAVPIATVILSALCDMSKLFINVSQMSDEACADAFIQKLVELINCKEGVYETF